MKNGDLLPLRNEYGFVDLTPFNASRLNNNRSAIQYDAAKLSPNKDTTMLMKTEALQKTRELLAVDIHRNTLLDWQKKSLIPNGVKKGKYVMYPWDMPFEGHASWTMMHGPFSCKHSIVREARTVALETLEKGDAWKLFAPIKPAVIVGEGKPDLAEAFNIALRQNAFFVEDPILYLAHAWLRYKILSVGGSDPLDSTKVICSVKVANDREAKKHPYRFCVF